MPFVNKLSDVGEISSYVSDDGPVVELRFKFVRYVLVLDDMNRCEELVAALRAVLDRPVAPPASSAPIPALYARRKK